MNGALRSIGKGSPALNAAAMALAQRLSASPQAASRWVEKDALRKLTRTAIVTNRARGFQVVCNQVYWRVCV